MAIPDFAENLLKKIFGDPQEKYMKGLLPVVDEINELEEKYEDFDKEEVRTEIDELKSQLGEKELDDILPEVFALTREVSKRTLEQRHFDVQLVGGIAMHEGKIAEMKTGEGKTLAATLPASLNALDGNGVHIVTVNDYLARRDTVWMGQIYHYLGLSVGCINKQQSFVYDPDYKAPDEDEDETRDELGSFKVVQDYLKPCDREEAYDADITYGTNNQFGFDYLRDNMVYDKEDRVQRASPTGEGLSFAILDEIDSILIDEARTPLIISQPDEEAPELYQEFSKIIPQLQEEDYEIDEKAKAINLTEQGIDRVEEILGVENIYQKKGIKYLHHLEQALRAQKLFKKDEDYVVKDGEVVIVDEFTGRLMPGRRWSGGLHQAIEAKEGVEIQPESRTLASITFQNFFQMYDKLAGMTGTAATSSEEFNKVYGLEVIEVPTNEPLIRKALPDKVYKTKRGKYKAVVEEVKKKHEKGQPLLVGTTSIEKNEHVSKLLKQAGISHNVLNAKNHEQEAEIIAQAGKLGAVTVATNMAGRGVDIVLGGNPPENPEKVKELGGLHVIGTERHEARRIDNQLRGRAGRQGDPGSSQFFVSLEDDLMRIFGGQRIQSLMEQLNVPEDQPIEANMVSGAIERAQKKVEGRNFDRRKHVLEYDNVLAKQRQKIYHRRKELLEADTLEHEVKEIIHDEIQSVINALWPRHEEIYDELEDLFPLSEEAQEEIKKKEAQQAIDYLIEKAEQALAAKERELGQEKMRQVEKLVSLKTLDFYWMNHLTAMDRLKDAVSLRAYGQKDPLVEYKTEGHHKFEQLVAEINYNIVKSLFEVESAERPGFTNQTF